MSSARVAPRSVIRAAATSAMTSSIVAGVGAHRAGAAGVADRAVAHGLLERLLAGLEHDRAADRQQHPVARTTSRRWEK